MDMNTGALIVEGDDTYWIPKDKLHEYLLPDDQASRARAELGLETGAPEDEEEVAGFQWRGSTRPQDMDEEELIPAVFHAIGASNNNSFRPMQTFYGTFGNLGGTHTF